MRTTSWLGGSWLVVEMANHVSKNVMRSTCGGWGTTQTFIFTIFYVALACTLR